jgi:hypothetical protein
MKFFLICFALVAAIAPGSAKPLTSVWKLEPATAGGRQTVEYGKTFLEQRMVPARVVKTLAAGEWTAGKVLPGDTYLFKVFQADGKTAYCSTKDQSTGHVAKSLFIPALDRRPCFIDANHDGIFEAVFTVFDKYGSALTPSGNISSAKPLAAPIRYSSAESAALPKTYNLSFAMTGSRLPEKARVGVGFAQGGKAEEQLLVRIDRTGRQMKLINLEILIDSVVGDQATIDLIIKPDMLLLGNSGGGFYGAKVSDLPANWNK